MTLEANTARDLQFALKTFNLLLIMSNKEILNFLFFLKDLKIHKHCVCVPTWQQLRPLDQWLPFGGRVPSRVQSGHFLFLVPDRLH